MKVFKKILGFLLVATLLVVMVLIAFLPTWFIEPEATITRTICYFVFLTVFFGEIILLGFILSKAVKE